MTTKQRLDEAYYAWCDADEAWRGALHLAFGKQACDRRYDMSQDSHPEECRRLGTAFHSARETYERALAEHRAAT